MVSVIIPCYNGEKYLAEALDSVANQSYAEWECIVVDDGSTDNSKGIVLSYMKKDGRFRYVNQVNAGPSAARNLGIKVSKGEFFQFLDSDDLIEKEKLKMQVEILSSSPSCGLVYGDMKYFARTPDGQMKVRLNDDKYWKNGTISGQGDEIIPVLLHGNIMVVDSPLIRKSVFDKIGLWDPQIWFNEDWDVWIRCALNGLSFHFDNTVDTFALVREHEDSRSRDVFKMFLHGLKVCLKVDRAVKRREYKKIIRPKIYYHFHFLENDVLAKYKTDKNRSQDMASALYRETGLLRYRIFAWLVRHAPYYFCFIYSRSGYLFNRLKSKTLYES